MSIWTDQILFTIFVGQMNEEKNKIFTRCSRGCLWRPFVLSINIISEKKSFHGSVIRDQNSISITICVLFTQSSIFRHFCGTPERPESMAKESKFTYE